MSQPAFTFGRRLRDQRERRGITLDTIAASTKISVSLLAALERDDLSAWPSGIFRRAFVREYATAIGVSPEPIVAEFTRLFPDRGRAPNADIPAPTSELRIGLVVDERWVTAPAVTRAIIALLEACLIVATAWAAARVEGANAWTICAILALMYYPLAAACLGQSPALWCVQRGFRTHRRSPRGVVAMQPREVLHVVKRRSPDTPREAPEQDSAGAASPLPAISR